MSNPDLAELITKKIVGSWLSHLADELRNFDKFAEDREVQDAIRLIKFSNKRNLIETSDVLSRMHVDPASMFDIQSKRIHEYKRQHLNVLHIITLYHRLKNNPALDVVPRTFIFGGKAAPGYMMAKLIIKLINSVADVVNADRKVSSMIKVAFLPDFNVKSAQRIYPAADLSEQISTAGKEASGTGNMKFAMNGALTIGTLDGANIEIRNQVGAENFFLFGLSAKEVSALQAAGYRPREYYEKNPELREAIDSIANGEFSHGDRDMFRPLVDSLLNYDPFLVLADYQSYVECQGHVSEAYRDERKWTQMAIMTIARMGMFSSDRAIREYDERIWRT